MMKPMGLPVEMVRINDGTFTMGDNSNNEYSDEKPEHQVTISAFKIGKYPVTQKQYEDVMGTNPSYFQGDTWEAAGGEAQGSRPVESVSWIDAVKFCNALSQEEGKTPAYTIHNEGKLDVSWDKGANGYRLPTEAEWEYACRAGTQTQWSFGDYAGDTDAYAWYSGNIGNGTHAVGLKATNLWGLCDMHGNVWEWCWDRNNSYQSGNQTDPDGDGDASGRLRILRGGGWNSPAEFTRSAYRHLIYNNIDYCSGFRLVCS